jgi:cytochrome c peroxidase
VDTDAWNFFSLTLGSYAAYRDSIPAQPRHPVRVRTRIPVPGKGPRALAVTGDQLWVANYFSDDLSLIDLKAKAPVAERVLFWPQLAPSLIREGEMLFNDATLCSQGWQSCASCHDTDARTDALNWDLLNDGVGNPKNTKSLVWAHQTPPAMALGVRTDAETAVRAGIHHILFSEQSDEVPEAINAFLKSIQVMPSPHLVNGKLSAAAQRGEKLFLSARTGCAECHPGPLFTDLAAHDVGTAASYKGMWGIQGADKSSDRFDTPTLVELWRTAPYLHDGSAASLRDLLTVNNPKNQHGRTSGLSPGELEDLLAYLLSL